MSTPLFASTSVTGTSARLATACSCAASSTSSSRVKRLKSGSIRTGAAKASINTMAAPAAAATNGHALGNRRADPTSAVSPVSASTSTTANSFAKSITQPARSWVERPHLRSRLKPAQNEIGNPTNLLTPTTRAVSTTTPAHQGQPANGANSRLPKALKTISASTPRSRIKRTIAAAYSGR